MDKKQIKKSYKMDLKHFLKSYYGADNDKVVSELCQLSHKELKKIAPFYGIELVRTKFDLITADQLATGDVILVNDVFNNPAPYINPNRVMAFNQEIDTELDVSYVSSIVDYPVKRNYQKSLKRVKKFKKGD